jgi:hypothetical protein
MTPDKSSSETFQVTYNLALVEIQKINTAGEEMYRVKFSNEVPPIMLACTKTTDGQCSWHIVPEGNAELANGIGRLIEQHEQSTGS